MGAKLRYALNPFSITTSTNSFAAIRIPNWGHTQEFRVGRARERSVMHQSTKKIFRIESHNIESIRKTMLMHEDIFQLQVKELHRLYDFQMKLMCDLKKQVASGTKDATQLVMWKKQMQDIRPNLPAYGMTTHDSGERSSSCSGENDRLPIGITNFERDSEEHHRGLEQQEPSPCVQMKMDDSRDEEIDVELSLSIGGGKRKNRKTSVDNTNERKACKSLELEGLGSSFGGMRKISSSALMVRRETIRGDFGEPSPVMSSSSVTPNQKQDKTESNWLLQDLSLNRT